MPQAGMDGEHVNQASKGQHPERAWESRTVTSAPAQRLEPLAGVVLPGAGS